MWISALWIIGGIWIIWAIYCCFLVRSLKEIKISSWHYKFSEPPWDEYPKNSFIYALRLIFMPILWIVALFFIICFILCWFLIGCPIRFLFNWVIWPFFFGRKPVDGFSKKYWGDLIDTGTLPQLGTSGCSLRNSFVGGISMETFMSLPLVVWLICAIDIIWGVHKLVSQEVAPLEGEILMGTLALMIVIAIVGFLKPHLFLKTKWIKLKNKLCVRLPIVD